MVNSSNNSEDFWKSPESIKYEEFAREIIPSDYMAYHMSNSVLRPEGKKLLDFGCFRGASCARLIDLGAEYVLGVDNSLININAATNIYKSSKVIRFQHVRAASEINTEMLFDAAAMTFVHPTIKTRSTLAKSFEKISKVLKMDGRLVIMGLNPKSFLDERAEYVYYSHQKFLKNEMVNGLPYKNTLTLLDGKELTITDHYWSNKLLMDLISDAGLEIEGLYDIDYNLPVDYLVEFRKSLKHAEARYGKIHWKDEWDVPLYQVISAVKVKDDKED